MKLLDELAQRMLQEKSSDFSQWALVFPNKRAGLFFKKILSQHIKNPIWSPGIVSIAELFETLSPYGIADKFTLIFKLYQYIEKHFSRKETFEQFFFWGETLLADFEEIDKYLIDTKYLFKDLRDVKDLESHLPFLDESQKKWIVQYWKNFSEHLSKNQEQTLAIWNILPNVYEKLTKDLSTSGEVYQGMMYRWVADNLSNGLDFKYSKIIFAGFNALSTSEETLIKWCLQNLDCEIFWDADDFYLKDTFKEAGHFLRSYQAKGGSFSPTFKNTYQSNAFENREFEVIECSTDTGQAQEVGRVLLEQAKAGVDPEKIGVILPNEKLLLPVLDAVPAEISELNITMGYPLQNSLVYGFLLSLLELQTEIKNKPESYYFKTALKVLSHPFVYDKQSEITKSLIQKINKENILFPHQSLFDSDDEFLNSIFRKVSGASSLIEYLQANLLQVVNPENNISEFETEFAFHFYRLLNNIKDLCGSHALELNQKTIIRLLNHAIYRERLPFEGEPLNGLQIMGFMETRNLHFDHVILLSSNEGILPPAKQDISFIPYAIRKAYGLPTVDHADAIFAYLFYRLVHNCKTMTIIFNSNSEKGNTGEISRFVKQLEAESSITFKHRVQHLLILPAEKYGISIPKTEQVFSRLKRYTLQNNQIEKRLSPSALNAYLECSLRFYFRYVLDLYEDEEVEENIEERILGLLFHHAIEIIYKHFDRDDKRSVSPENINEIIKNIDDPIKEAFLEHFKYYQSKKLTLTGQSELAYEVIKELVTKVLSIDKKYAPFDIVGIESNQDSGYQLDVPIGPDFTIGLKGVIDRIDKKGDVVRIIDYKTGSDNREFADIESLFDKENKTRNKAVFQTFLYALFFQNAHRGNTSILQAGLFNLRDMYSEEFDILIKQKAGRDKRSVQDIRPFLDEYKSLLSNLLAEIFDPDIGFVQTDDVRKCVYCPYNQICSRESKQ